MLGTKVPPYKTTCNGSTSLCGWECRGIQWRIQRGFRVLTPSEHKKFFGTKVIAQLRVKLCLVFLLLL